MVDQCDKPVNMGSFVIDEENYDQKSWMLFEGTCNICLLVFSRQIFVTVLMLV